MTSSVDEQQTDFTVPLPPGTTVTSVEVMAALPVDTVVDLTYDNRTEKWQRVEGGWVCVHRNNRVVPESARVALVQERFFIGVLTNNMVRVSTPPLPEFHVGQTLRTGSDYIYLVHTMAEEGAALMAVFSTATGFIGPDRANPQFLQRDTVRQVSMAEVVQPEWLTGMAAYYHRELERITAARDERDRLFRQAVTDRDQAMRERNEARAQAHTLRDQAATIPQGLVDALKAYADDHDDDDFDAILADHGIGRQTDVEVTVTLIGYNYVTISEASAASELGISQREIVSIDDASTVNWRKQFTVTRTADFGNCACGEVSDSDDDVESQAPEGADSIEIDSTSCPND